MNTHANGLRILLPLLIPALIFLQGCGPEMPQGVREAVGKIPDMIQNTEKRIKKSQEAYQKLTKEKSFQPLASIAQKENWTGYFNRARETLKGAQTQYKTITLPLLKKDNPQAAETLMAQTQRIQVIINQSLKQAGYPAQRFSLIQATMADLPGVMSRTRPRADTLQRRVAALASGPVARAREQYPAAAEALDARFGKFLEMQAKTASYMELLTTMARNHAAGKSIDFARFTDMSQYIQNSWQKLEKQGRTFEASLGELSRSYTKILQDMKESYRAVIVRESWDENSDYDAPRQVRFRVDVPLETYEILAANIQGPIATITAGFTGSRFKSRMGNAWQTLNLNPTSLWPQRNHNAAEFWVEEIKASHFHKYLIEEDGETRETDWVQVNPSFYESNLPYLGMAILSKPYGVFEQDRLAQPAPPGMANVGNPAYGEWKKDSNGESFWSWYGRYAFFSNLFFFPPSYYSYGSWYGWRQDYRYKKPYFGKDKHGKNKYGTFGSHVKKSPRYQNSTFGKTGGFKASRTSVRGAGTRVRGGGPGGKGK